MACVLHKPFFDAYLPHIIQANKIFMALGWKKYFQAISRLVRRYLYGLWLVYKEEKLKMAVVALG